MAPGRPCCLLFVCFLGSFSLVPRLATMRIIDFSVSFRSILGLQAGVYSLFICIFLFCVWILEC
uniref:Uncharacterized protein n=1 Tax=Arundo donax TaxID=35708 RepID=A0A0A9CZ06_ARUDO